MENVQSPSAYDPYLNRDVENPLSNIGAFIHLLKCAIGTGCFVMPEAFKWAGWLNGLMTGPFIGIVVVYAVHILVKAMNEVCARNETALLTYPEAMKYGLLEGPTWLHICNRPAKIIVEIFLASYHFGICAIYVVVIAENLCNFFKALGGCISSRLYMAVLIIPLCLIYFIRDLKHLVPFCAAANCLLLIGYGIVLYYVFGALPPISERKLFGDIYRYPLFFGDFLFSIEAIGVIIAIEANMANPKHLLGLFGVLNQVMFLVIVLYIFFGFFGYWRYGSDILANITFNIPQDIPALVGNLLIAVAIYISYSLQGYIVMDVVWTHYLEPLVPEGRKILCEFSTRCVIVFVSVAVALWTNKLGHFVALVGAFSISTLGLMFPAVLDTCLRYGSGDYGPWKIYLLRNTFIFIFGVCGGTTGTVFAIKDLIG